MKSDEFRRRAAEEARRAFAGKQERKRAPERPSESELRDAIQDTGRDWHEDKLSRGAPSDPSSATEEVRRAVVVQERRQTGG